MKIEFSKKVTFHPKWGGNLDAPEGERMVAILTTMDNGSLLSLQESFKKNDEGTVDTRTVMATAAKLLPGHVEISNLFDQNGPVTIQDIASIPFYMDLALELALKLAEISSPTKVDEKNSQAPRD